MMTSPKTSMSGSVTGACPGWAHRISTRIFFSSDYLCQTPKIEKSSNKNPVFATVMGKETCD